MRAGSIHSRMFSSISFALLLLCSTSDALRLDAVVALRHARPTRVPRDAHVVMEDASVDPVDESAPESTTEVAPAEVAPPKDPNAPTMPVSSLDFKLKGLATIAVGLVGVGFILNYAFTPGSIFSAPEEPQVNQALVKYTTALEKVAPTE